VRPRAKVTIDSLQEVVYETGPYSEGVTGVDPPPPQNSTQYFWVYLFAETLGMCSLIMLL